MARPDYDMTCMFSVHTIFQNICKWGVKRFRFPQWWMWQSCSSKRDDRLNFPPASSFSAAMPSPESYPPAVSLVIESFGGRFSRFLDFWGRPNFGQVFLSSFLTLFFCPSCCLLCLMRSRRRRVSSCEFARLLIVVSGIGRFTCTCNKYGLQTDFAKQWLAS